LKKYDIGKEEDVLIRHLAEQLEHLTVVSQCRMKQHLNEDGNVQEEYDDCDHAYFAKDSQCAHEIEISITNGGETDGIDGECWYVDNLSSKVTWRSQNYQSQ